MTDSFPVLTIGPDTGGFGFNQESSGLIESKLEDGLRSTRKRRTWNLNVFRMKCTGMTNDDKDSLVTFYDDTVVAGSLDFLWFNPQDQQTYNVKFFNVPTFKVSGSLLPERRWDVYLEFIEASPNSPYTAMGGRLGEGRLSW